MKIISLASQHAGYACTTAHYISKYFYNNTKPREFFDLITVSMKSITPTEKINETKFNIKCI
jgi:hypothetical protein